MKPNSIRKGAVITIALFFMTSGCVSVFGYQIEDNASTKSVLDGSTHQASSSDIKYINIELDFSYPEVVFYNGYIVVRVTETDLNMIDYGKPILPVNLSVFELQFGTRIVDVDYVHSPPEIINLTGKLSFGRAAFDSIEDLYPLNTMDPNIYENSDPYPADWVSYHTGGGLSYGEHTTFLVVRVYPVRYYPADDQLQFIQHITVNISYEEPDEPLLEDNDVYDLLIIAPSSFNNYLQTLVSHKEDIGVKTNLVTTEEIYADATGRDEQEKIKYYIKDAIENWGISYVLLMGGIKGQGFSWNLPIRYSHVVPPTEQEYPEQSFISDLYYADIYDGEGNFSSWDSNNNDVFAEWNESIKDEMDIYPDVYLGRLPCRNIFELRVMVKKILNYEEEPCDESWFKNLLLVAGDSYNDVNHFNEGELISEKAVTLMPDFTPVRVYAKSPEEDINRQTVNKALNAGCGFAYFCGHGSHVSWNTHYPPNGTIWATGYDLEDMFTLINGGKLPVTVVGGCHNGQFDISIIKSILTGIKNYGIINYFRPSGWFWFDGWAPNCWAWLLNRKIGGGAIATIANTGLGTHGDGDMDNNSVADYLEVLDGWLELRFLELYGMENQKILGKNHGETLTGYLHRFFGNDDKMDVKMVQQWALFGDSSLKIGG